ICKFCEITQRASKLVDLAEMRHRVEDDARPYRPSIAHVNEGERQVGGERQYDLAIVLDGCGLCKWVLHEQARPQHDPFYAASTQPFLDRVVAAPDDRRRIWDDQEPATGNPDQILHASFQCRVEYIVLLLDHVWIVTCHHEDARHAFKRFLKRRSVSQFSDGRLSVRPQDLFRFCWIAHDTNGIVTQLLKFLDDRAASIPSRPHDGNHTFRSLARVGT